VLTARESSEARECGPGSAQSTGMQEGVGERRRVQVSHWELRKLGFHRPGESRCISVVVTVVTFRPWGLGPLLLLSPPPWGLGGVITNIALRTQGWHHCRCLEGPGGSNVITTLRLQGWC